MQNTRDTKLLFDLSKPGCRGAVLPEGDVPAADARTLLPGRLRPMFWWEYSQH